MTASGFEPEDVMNLLGCVIGDKALVDSRVNEWMGAHVHYERDAFTLLCCIGSALAEAMNLNPRPGTTAVMQVGGPGEVPWEVRMVGQLITTAANNDSAMLNAVAQSIVSQGQEPFTEVMTAALSLFRKVALTAEQEAAE